MEFGIFNAVCLTPKFRAEHGANAEHRRIMDELAYIRAADKAGFKYSWASEHHFLTEYSHLSASESFMAFAAAQTKNIHLGSGIINLTPPVNHPARIAERVAMLDHLSEGRFEFGTGRGSSTTEQRGFGIEDQELTREMVAETLPQIVRMWKEEDYSYDGRFFSMPERNVLPKPYTKPHPPLWVAAGSPGTFELAARQGLGVLCFAFGPPEGFIPLIEKYKKDIKNAEPVGDYVNDNVMITTQMLCLEDGGKAREAFARMDGGYYISLVFRYLDTFPRPPGIPEWPQTIPDQTPEQIDKSIESRSIAIGDPDEVTQTIKRFEETGADQLAFGMLSSAMPIETCEEAVATFGKHVLPQFDKDPVHSTTRQREAQIGS
ncbi:MAG TPA: LLM class flavin-dependent oxidoreductase [Acidimicrobiales bacterium]|nr:LLM class flavin-dependent oxidoreductase [Acidimicrobiales bacterium]